MVFKIICVLNESSLSNMEGLKVPQEIAVWIFDTFDNNFGIENDFTKYLKERCL